MSRWYGGILLGPARFSHIEACAQEVCRKFKRKEELEECISTLSTLDDILADLRTELANLPESSTAMTTALGGNDSLRTPKKPDYSQFHADKDLPKAQRLVGAREKAITSVKGSDRKEKGNMTSSPSIWTQPRHIKAHHHEWSMTSLDLLMPRLSSHLSLYGLLSSPSGLSRSPLMNVSRVIAALESSGSFECLLVKSFAWYALQKVGQVHPL